VDFSKVKEYLEKRKLSLVSLMIQSEDFRLNICDVIRRNPVHWVQMLFGVKLWRGEEGACGQANMLEAIFDHENVCVGSGHGTGKTYLSGVTPPIWMLSHCETLDCYVVITGASWNSVERMIFPGIRRQMKDSRIPIGPLPMATSMRWSERWQTVGMSPDNAEVAQGWHSKDGTLILADEGSALENKVLDSYLSIMTDGDHIGIFGNPIRSEGSMANILSESPDTRGIWYIGFVASYDTPNVLYPELPPIKGLATPSAIKKWKQKWPEGTPEYEARIRGRVPDQGDKVFIARSLVKAACARTVIPWQQDTNLVLGIDVARSLVGDHTVFTLRGDHSLHLMEKRRGMSKDDVINRLFEIRRDFAPAWVPTASDEAERLRLESVLQERRDAEWKHQYQETMNRLHFALNKSRKGAISVDSVFIDGTGLGSGYADDMDRLGYPPTARFIANGSANNAQEMGNRRAEGYDTTKKALQTLAIPSQYSDDYSELCNLQYRYNERGQLFIELKEDYKKRYGKSPDVADSLAISYSRLPGEKVFAAAQSGHANPIKIDMRPIITHEDRTGKGSQWWMHLEGQPPQADTPGNLLRAMWLASRNAACVWVHKDVDGIWTIYDALTSTDTTIRAFWGDVIERSKGHHYLWDVFSSPEDPERNGESHLTDELWTVLRNLPVTPGQPRLSMPQYQQPISIRGSAGLDTLQRLILSQMSWFKEHPYWQGKDPLKYRTNDALAAYPDEVVDAIARARLEERSWTDELEESRPEGLVAEGGPLVACLRLLAVQGAGI